MACPFRNRAYRRSKRRIKRLIKKTILEEWFSCPQSGSDDSDCYCRSFGKGLASHFDVDISGNASLCDTDEDE